MPDFVGGSRPDISIDDRWHSDGADGDVDDDAKLKETPSSVVHR